MSVFCTDIKYRFDSENSISYAWSIIRRCIIVGTNKTLVDAVPNGQMWASVGFVVEGCNQRVKKTKPKGRKMVEHSE